MFVNNVIDVGFGQQDREQFRLGLTVLIDYRLLIRLGPGSVAGMTILLIRKKEKKQSGEHLLKINCKKYFERGKNEMRRNECLIKYFHL